MRINYTKGVYKLEEVGEIVLKSCPGRFKNLNSAYASVKITANKLGIQDINGKKRNKLISARDAERIVNTLMGKKRGRKKKAEQVSLFDDNIVDWLDPYLPNSKKEEPTETSPEEEMPKEVDPQELFEAGVELMRAISRFAEVIGMNGRG